MPGMMLAAAVRPVAGDAAPVMLPRLLLRAAPVEPLLTAERTEVTCGLVGTETGTEGRVAAGTSWVRVTHMVT